MMNFVRMSYKLLDHATDAIIEVKAKDLDEAFTVAGQAVADITIDTKSVSEKQEWNIAVSGEDLRYLLFNWLEAVIYQMITDGFAIARVEAKVTKNNGYTIEATTHGEPIDLKKHGFKVEIKAPTFHEMEIDETDGVRLKFLLDL